MKHFILNTCIKDKRKDISKSLFFSHTFTSLLFDLKFQLHALTSQQKLIDKSGRTNGR